jgi:hypothetical protein
MASHDPVAFAHELGARLASRARHVCVFIGAGAGKACGLPAIAELESKVASSLPAEQREAFAGQLKRGNLEQALSRIRRIATLLEGESTTVDDLSVDAAVRLDNAICQAVVSHLAVDGADLDPMRAFASWAAAGDYHTPIEVFTVNYDLLIETAFEEIALPYFDGFVGALRARFRADLVEAIGGRTPELPSSFVRLWKIHGSVNWASRREAHEEIVRLGAPVSGDVPAAIYPSDAKYEESRRVPFVVLHDRLRRALEEPETLVIVSGYSFSDQHLNETLFEATRRRPRSEVIAFCRSEIPEQLAEEAKKTPNLQALANKEAIIASVRADWKEPTDPPAGIWDNGFLLGDFSGLTAFLSRSTAADDSIAGRLAATRRAASEGA